RNGSVRRRKVMKPTRVRTLIALAATLTLILAVGQMLTIVPAAAAGMARYSITDLGTLGGSYSEAFGINASGQVVGDSGTPTSSGHAFVYSGGQMSDLNLPGTLGTARAVNASGQIAGYYYNGAYEAFLYTNGQVTD